MAIPGFKVGWGFGCAILFWLGCCDVWAEPFEAIAKRPDAALTGTITGEYTLESHRLIVRVKGGSYTWHRREGVPRKKIVNFNVWLTRWKEDHSTIEYIASSEVIKVNKTVEDNETLQIGTYKLILPVSDWTAAELGRMWLAISITDAEVDAPPGVTWHTHAFQMPNYLFSEEKIDFGRLSY